MNSNKKLFKNNFTLILTLLFVYVILFEFVLPINKILPKPSLLYESLLHVWSDYNLLMALTTTTSAVYIAMIIGLIILLLTPAFYFKIMIEYRDSILAFSFLKFIPALFLIILFNLWFPQNYWAEIAFSFLLMLFFSFRSLFIESPNVREEYILIAHNLNLSTKDIYKNIYWKAELPAYSKDLKRIHLYLWAVVLIYEFVGNSVGIGKVFRQILLYHDFIGVFAVLLVIYLIIITINFIIKIYATKLIHWKQ